MAKSIKEYGTDLKKDFDDLEKKQKTLRNKIIKRFIFLLANSNDPYLNGFIKEATDSYSTDMMLFIILRVEAAYAAKTTQLDMFTQKLDGGRTVAPIVNKQETND